MSQAVDIFSLRRRFVGLRKRAKTSRPLILPVAIELLDLRPGLSLETKDV